MTLRRMFRPDTHLCLPVLAVESGIRSWLASQGVPSCTFDYRYFGLSFPPPFNANKFSLEERDDAMKTCPEDVSLSGTWAKKDFAAVVRYMSDLYPDVPLTIVGNSLGCREFKLITT